MLKEFEVHIEKNELFSKSDKLLLAISGGIDSTVLAHLLSNAGYKFTLAHCNFQLRGKDSDADEKFCIALAKKLGVKIHSKKFDTLEYCKKSGSNVQLAARQLRYQWFQDLTEENNWDYVLTAHHANDLVETMLINMLRGTGINGVKGIPMKNGKIVRPLLCFKRSEIESYAAANKIAYREDLSNKEDKYERNFIRNQIIPLLKKINKNLEDTFLRNSFHFLQEAGIVKEFLSNKAVEYATQTHDALFINKTRLKHERYLESIMHYLISGFGFNGTQQRNIIKAVKSGNTIGKIFTTATHQLVIDRNDLIVKRVAAPEQELRVNSLSELRKLAFLKVSQLKKFSLPHENEFVVSASKISFPVVFRPRRNGDRFRPFGLKGSKLLSDYMKEQKMNAFDKENLTVMINGNGEIMWLLGYRSDDRYKVRGRETDLLKISILE